jgi:TIR domain-containing protein
VPGLSSWGIFLSYRRADAAPYARLLQTQFRERLPDARVFMDLDSIEAGLDFAEVIRGALDSCAVLVALIGRQWATLADEKGHPRIKDPNDFVRFEIHGALQRGVRVIPVLVDGASPLRQEQLPAELHELARLEALELSYDRYQYDAGRLLEVIQRVGEAAEAAEGSQELPQVAGRWQDNFGYLVQIQQDGAAITTVTTDASGNHVSQGQRTIKGRKIEYKASNPNGQVVQGELQVSPDGNMIQGRLDISVFGTQVQTLNEVLVRA